MSIHLLGRYPSLPRGLAYYVHELWTTSEIETCEAHSHCGWRSCTVSAVISIESKTYHSDLLTLNLLVDVSCSTHSHPSHSRNSIPTPTQTSRPGCFLVECRDFPGHEISDFRMIWWHLDKIVTRCDSQHIYNWSKLISPFEYQFH